MPSDAYADVVVIGFGLVGATAALAAATRDARVLVLDQSPSVPRRTPRRVGAPAKLGALISLRAAALAAGVQVRPQCRVHELGLIGGQVASVGFATLAAGDPAATGHRMLDRLGRGMPRPLSRVAARAAALMWDSRFRVDEICCAAVVLALDPVHWEFVACAVPPPGRVGVPPRRLAAVHGVAAEPGPSGLRVDDVTRVVMTRGDVPVPGLYSAVSIDPGTADHSALGALFVAGAAGHNAVRGELPRLRSIS